MDTNGHIILSEDCVSPEVEKLLEEKGFNKSCCTGYAKKSNSDGTCELIRVCTLQMACKWLREEKKLVISIDLNYSDNSYSYSIDSIIEHRIVGYGLGETYEEAVEAALKYTLKNLI